MTDTTALLRQQGRSLGSMQATPFGFSPTPEMAGTADAAKNALNSLFDKTKDALSTAAETTKGYANQAQQAIGKIIPGAAPAEGQAPAGAPGSENTTAPGVAIPPQ